MAQKADRHKKGSTKEDSWKELEQYVADQLNAIPFAQEARRQLRSGGIWFLPGDVAHDLLLPECKERDTHTAGGEKSFTIKKEWITKMMEEAKLADKFPALVFRFKNDDETYFVDDFTTLRDMIHLIKVLQEDNMEYKKERDIYKAAYEKLKRQTGGDQ